jgi:hypothetical protein
MPAITINYPAGDGARFAAALGKAHALKDTQDPPQKRSATAAECKAWLIGRAQQLIVDIEGRDAQAAAIAAISITPLDMT